MDAREKDRLIEMVVAATMHFVRTHRNAPSIPNKDIFPDIKKNVALQEFLEGSVK